MGVFYSKEHQSNNNQYYFGYLPDHYDINDKNLKLSGKIHKKKNVDLRDNFPLAYNQKNLNCSTACAIAAVIEYNLINSTVAHRTPVVPSIMYIYYIGRMYRDQCDKNVGVSIKDTLKQLNKYGLKIEKDYPFDAKYFHQKPSFNHHLFKNEFVYKKVNKDIDSLKLCLSIQKPIIFGFAVYESFFNELKWSNDGIMPIPREYEQQIGLQTGVCVGYSNKRKQFLIRNSYGSKWKNDGYFFMPFEYIVSGNCENFWVLDFVEFKNDFDFEKSSTSSTNTKKHKKKKKLKKKKASSDHSGSDDDFEQEEKIIQLTTPTPSNTKQSKNFLIQHEG